MSNKNKKRLHEIHFPNHSEAYILNDAADNVENAWAYGTNSHATADSSHAEGESARATHKGSHVEGLGTQSCGEYSHVQGKYNEPEESKAFVIGGGSPDEHKNIYTMDWDGNSNQTGSFHSDGDIEGNRFSFKNGSFYCNDEGRVYYKNPKTGLTSEIAVLTDIPKINDEGKVENAYSLDFSSEYGLIFTKSGDTGNPTIINLSETYAEKDNAIVDKITFGKTKTILVSGNKTNIGEKEQGYYLTPIDNNKTQRKIFSDADTIPIENLDVGDVASYDVLPLVKGGTGTTNASDACTNLGAVKKTGDTMTGPLTIESNGGDKALLIQQVPQNDGKIWAPYLGFKENNTKWLMGGIFAYRQSDRNTLCFRNCSLTNGKYENFFLPNIIDDKVPKDADYDILTTKSLVTIPQGGTGASTAAGACAAITNGQVLSLKSNQYFTESKYAIKLNDSDIVGVSGIWFNDSVSSREEGIHFKRGDNNNYDRLYALNGKLYIVPNESLTSTGTPTEIITTSGVWNSQTGALQNTWSNVSSPISLNTLAYWDGRYQVTNNSSNLKYCNQGAFSDLTVRWISFSTDAASSNAIKTIEIPGIPIRFFGCVQSSESGYANGVMTHLDFSIDGSSKNFNLKQSASNAAYTAKSSWSYNNSTRKATIKITPDTSTLRKYKGYILILPPPPTVS